MADPRLSVTGLTVTTTDGDPVVSDLGFDVDAGQIIGIVGESGSGKSVTCRAVLGILPQRLHVAAGNIRLGGHDVLDYGFDEWRPLRGREVSAVFQDPGSYLNPSLPVGRQLETTLRAQLGLRRRAAAVRAEELFTELGLDPASGIGHKIPRELSGGMLQRAVLAIALAGQPSLLIADEVTTALDVSVQAQVLDVLRGRRDATGMSVVFVSHDLAVVGAICDTIIVMHDGRIVEAGQATAVLRDPRHEYTRLLVSEHRRYGIERFTGREESRESRYAPTVA
ncbi:MAG: ABC transporter ATP-binding protein [Mycobacterium sp.]